MAATLRLNASLPQDIARAADILRSGGTVAFPTEPVYGLGANALSPEAVARIFNAKQRPSWDPLIVHVPTFGDALALVDTDKELRRRVEALAEAFWPGPLTLLLPRQPRVPDAVTAGRPLVGIRVPAQETAQALLRLAGLPVAAPSANRFGHTSPTTAQHVLDDLDGRIDAVLDGGPTSIGLESTVLDPTTVPMTLYRPGALMPERLAEVAGVPVTVFQPESSRANEEKLGDATMQASLPAPGVGLRHYAPHARLVLVQGTPEALRDDLARGATSAGATGVLLPKDWPVEGDSYFIERWAAWNDVEGLASTLFSGLRSLDARGVETIYCPVPEPGGLRDAIRDRLQKAARSSN